MTSSHFKNSDERNEFIIGLIVIALFFGLFAHISSSNGELAEARVEAELEKMSVRENEQIALNTAEENAIVLEKRTVTKEEVNRPSKRRKDPRLVDTDNDGIADFYDHCPKTSGDAANNGCPE